MGLRFAKDLLEEMEGRYSLRELVKRCCTQVQIYSLLATARYSARAFVDYS